MLFHLFYYFTIINLKYFKYFSDSKTVEILVSLLKYLCQINYRWNG